MLALFCWHSSYQRYCKRYRRTVRSLFSVVPEFPFMFSLGCQRGSHLSTCVCFLASQSESVYYNVFLGRVSPCQLLRRMFFIGRTLCAAPGRLRQETLARGFGFRNKYRLVLVRETRLCIVVVQEPHEREGDRSLPHIYHRPIQYTLSCVAGARTSRWFVSDPVQSR